MPPSESHTAYRLATALTSARQGAPGPAADSAGPGDGPRFGDALAGRYGLSAAARDPATATRAGGAGTSAADAAVRAATAGAAGTDGAAAAADTLDVSSMSATAVRRLARNLFAGGRLDAVPAALMGLDRAALPFAGDPVFRDSPLAGIMDTLGGAGGGGGPDGALAHTRDWLAEHTAQHRHLVANGGDPAAIEASEAVLGQLRRLHAERTLFAALDAPRADAGTGGGATPGLPAGGAGGAEAVSALYARRARSG